jgi:hypothetical protein
MGTQTKDREKKSPAKAPVDKLLALTLKDRSRAHIRDN